MPSKLEQEGKVRNKFAIAYAVAEPEVGTRFDVMSILGASGQEILREVRGTITVKDSRGKEAKIPSSVMEEEWMPEMVRRYFQPYVPEPMYTSDDLEAARNSSMRILTKAERDAYVKDPKNAERSKAFYAASEDVSKIAHSANVSQNKGLSDLAEAIQALQKSK